MIEIAQETFNKIFSSGEKGVNKVSNFDDITTPLGEKGVNSLF